MLPRRAENEFVDNSSVCRKGMQGHGNGSFEGSTVRTGFRVSGIRQVQARVELPVLKSSVHDRTYDEVGQSGRSDATS